MKCWLVCAIALASGAAHAERARVRWLGVAVEGRAPARLADAADAEVAVALGTLGVQVVRDKPFLAEGGAHCIFLAPPPKPALCTLVVQAVDGARAERKVDVPYRDADDLARSLALLLADTLQLEMPNVLAGNVEPIPDEPPPERPPPVKPPPDERAPEEPRVRSNVAVTVDAQGRVHVDERAPRRPPVSVTKKSSPPFAPARLFVGAGPAFAVGFSGEPVLYGAAVRATWLFGVLRVAANLSLTGARALLDGYELSFFRALTGPRFGAGWQSNRLDLEVTLGPALYWLAIDARPGGHHDLVTGAGVIGARFAVAVTRSLALEVTGDGILTFTDEQVDAGPTRVVSFSRFSLELGVGLSYRR